MSCLFTRHLEQPFKAHSFTTRGAGGKTGLKYACFPYNFSLVTYCGALLQTLSHFNCFSCTQAWKKRFAGMCILLSIEASPFLASPSPQSKLAFLPCLMGLVVFTCSYFPPHNLCASEDVMEAGWSQQLVIFCQVAL